MPKSLAVPDDARSEMVHPDAIDDHPRCERIAAGWRCHGQLEAAAPLPEEASPSSLPTACKSAARPAFPDGPGCPE